MKTISKIFLGIILLAALLYAESRPRSAQEIIVDTCAEGVYQIFERSEKRVVYQCEGENFPRAILSMKEK